MARNIISLNFTDPDLTIIDEGLALLEQKLAPLTGLSPEVRRGLVKMGDKSEAFCRKTLMVMGQNTHLLPPSFDLADAQNDLAQLEKLRPRAARLRRLLERADDGETALGSDVMSAAPEGYAMLKVSCSRSPAEARAWTRSGRVCPPASPARPESRPCPPPPSIEPVSPGPNASRSKRGAPAARLFALHAKLRALRTSLGGS